MFFSNFVCYFYFGGVKLDSLGIGEYKFFIVVFKCIFEFMKLFLFFVC